MTDSFHDRAIWRLMHMPPGLVIPILRTWSTGWFYAASTRGRRRRIKSNFNKLRAVAGIGIPAAKLSREYMALRMLNRVAPAIASFHRDPGLGGRIVAHGYDHVRSVLDSGRGCVVATAHVGAPGLPAAYILRRGARVATIRRPEIQKGAGDGIHVRVATYGAEPMYVSWEEAPAAPLKRGLEIVRQGGVVSCLIDGHFGSRGVVAPVFGRPFAFKTGFLEVARMARVPLILCFGRVEQHRLSVRFLPPVEPQVAEDIDQFVHGAAVEVETEIRENPAGMHWQRLANEVFLDKSPAPHAPETL